jgi:hypothetical protein
MSLPFKSDSIEVVSGGAANPKFVAGTADPTGGLAAPEGSIFLRYVASNGRAYVKSGPGDTDWSLILAGAGGSTLDAAYDFGGAGAGRIITADAGAVQIDGPTSNTQAALHINRQPGVSSAAVGISVTLNANVTGPGITVAQGGSGPAIQISSGALEIANSSPGLSPSNTGRIKYNSGTQTFQVSMNGGAYVDVATGAVSMAIGNPITSATAGSVLFAGVGGVLQQDNAEFFWNDTTNKLGIGTNDPAGAGYGFAADIKAHIKKTSHSFLLIDTATASSDSGIILSTLTAPTDVAIFLDESDSQKLKIATGNVDNDANRNTNTRMTIFQDGQVEITSAFNFNPTSKVLRLTQSAADPGDGTGIITLRNSLASSLAQIAWQNNASAFKAAWGYSNTGGDIYLYADTGVHLNIYTGATHRMRVAATSGNVGIGTGNVDAAYRLEVQNAGASQIHISNGAVDSGGYLTSTVASQLYLSGGLGFDGTNLRAKATTAAVVELNNGNISFQGSSGLTIGAITVMTERMLIHVGGGVEVFNSDAATVSSASRGKLRYTTSGQKAQWSFNGGAYFDAATYAAALTAGSVVFANSSNQLAQDNARLFWNDTNKALLVTSNHATDGSLFARSTVTTGPSALGVSDSSGNFKSYWGYFNSAYAFTYMRNKSGVLSFGGENIIFGNATIATHEFGMTANSLFFEMFNGGSAAVSSANAGRIRYNTTGQKFEVSTNGGAYADLAVGSGMSIGGSITSATAGSVLFAGAAGILQQDNANFFWDDSNNRLGIGTNAPGSALDIAGNVSGDVFAHIRNASSNVAATTYIVVENDAGSKANIQVGSTGTNATTFAAFANRAAYMSEGTGIGVSLAGRGSGADIRFFTDGVADTNERARIAADGGVEFRNSSAAAVSASNAGRIRYNTSGQKFQVSTNGGAYADLATTAGPVVEYLSADGAADPAADVTYVSGTGTDLTLANGTVGGFVKKFVITGGSGTITPANLADGDVLTWTAAPANVSFIWDATNTTWHVVGSPYNMVTT